MAKSEIPVTDETIGSNLFIDTEFGRDLFDSILKNYGKIAWNSFSERLCRHNMEAMFSSPEPKTVDDHCMPVCVHVTLRGEKFWKMDLSGIDFIVPDLGRADFTEANLRGCRFGTTEYASFVRADLSDADFTLGDITGSNFAGACLIGAKFDNCHYSQRQPPSNLAKELFEKCRAFPEHWNEGETLMHEQHRFKLAVAQAELRSFW